MTSCHTPGQCNTTHNLLSYKLNVLNVAFQGVEIKAMMQTAVLNLQSLYDKLRSQVDLLNDNIEPSEYFIHLFKDSTVLLSYEHKLQSRNGNTIILTRAPPTMQHNKI